jgi:DNA-binding transcriptional ArsR family regulator
MLKQTDIFESLSLDRSVAFLRAAGEHTRLRLIALLCKSDLTVSDLTEILSQSQPRISRHLRLLVEAGLAERYQEGAWAYFRSSDQKTAGAFNRFMIDHIDIEDPLFTRDAERLEAVKNKRAEKAALYFAVPLLVTQSKS